jgi:hypothetical protein
MSYLHYMEQASKNLRLAYHNNEIFNHEKTFKHISDAITYLRLALQTVNHAKPTNPTREKAPPKS